MSLDIWVALLAFILMMLATIQGIHPPQDRQWKIAFVTIVAVTGIILLVLAILQTAVHTTEQQAAVDAQSKLQSSLTQNQKECGP